MQIIIQRFTQATPIGGEIRPDTPGLVLFVSSVGNVGDGVASKAASKVVRLRLWDRWSKNVMDVSKRVVIVPIRNCGCGSLRAALTELGCLVQVHTITDPITFANDGPCTMIVDI